jgi:hypothetical protein
MFGNRSMMNFAGLCVMSSSTIRAGFFHLAVNRARHDVARRERFQRMNAVHEFASVERFQRRLRRARLRKSKMISPSDDTGTSDETARTPCSRCSRPRDTPSPRRRRSRCRDSSCRDKPCRNRPSPAASPARKKFPRGSISCRKRKRRDSGFADVNRASGW